MSGYDYFKTDRRSLFALVAWFLVGVILSVIVMAFLVFTMSSQAALDYGTVICYPLMFIPAMLYARRASLMNSFDGEKIPVDGASFSAQKWLVYGVLVMLSTFALGFMTDVLTLVMPPMSDSIEAALSSLTQGNFLLNFICVSIFAPFFEEWLCRGMVLRGLLSLKVRGGVMRPWAAIVLSAVFFALIHGNIWQSLPALIIGILFGWIYYRTRSLKLTMLMHFTNNTLSLILSNVDSLSETESWLDVFPPVIYGVMFVACAILMVLVVRYFGRQPLPQLQGADQSTSMTMSE